MQGQVTGVTRGNTYVVKFVDGTETTKQKAEMLEGVLAYKERGKCTKDSFIGTRAAAEALWIAAGKAARSAWRRDCRAPARGNGCAAKGGCGATQRGR
jgi:hypothetical protein